MVSFLHPLRSGCADPLPSRLPKRPFTRQVRAAAFTLVEQVVALGVIAVSLLMAIILMRFMEFQNRASSQRMLAAAIEMEMLELFKSLSYTQLTNSTAALPIYLKQSVNGGGNANWIVPALGAWQAVPVEAVNSTSGSDPTLVPNKLPGAVWSVTFTPNSTNPSLTTVTVTIQWQSVKSSNRKPLSLSMSTVISAYGANL